MSHDPPYEAGDSVLPSLHIYYSGQSLTLYNMKLTSISLGPKVGFAGSAVSDRVHLDVLGPILPLSCHKADIDLRLRQPAAFVP